MSEFIKKLSSLKQDRLIDSVIDSKISEIKRAGITDESQYKKFLILKRAAKNLGIQEINNISQLLNYKISNLNDAYYYIVKSKINQIRKTAYPNYSQVYNDVSFDINKWIDITHMIYDAVRTGKMDKNEAIDNYAKSLDINNEEDIAFKRWFNFYASGEHKKYSEQEDDLMKKKAIYVTDTMNLGPYSQSGGSFYRSRTSPGFDLPGSSLENEEEEKPMLKGKVNLKDWKTRLLSRIRGIQKLMVAEEYVDPDTFNSISDTLNQLANQVYRVKLESTASDLASRAANSLVKIGAFSEAEELRKIAQEAGPSPAAPAAPATQPAAAAAPTPPAAPGQPGAATEAPAEQEEDKGPAAGIPRGDEVEPVDFEDIKPVPGPRDGEYEELAGDISVDKAAKKLDEVAGMLADRRIIRLLAEFDIMLDKIGIASMFPELAESQSKLIDAYSYALTRVTKMMGQLSNAQTVIQSAGAIPGIIPNRMDQEETPEESQE
jgi:hypothetical protein